MIFSKNLLNYFFPDIANINPKQFKEALLKSGIEIESIDNIQIPKGICYGLVQECTRIEDSDHLNMCKVHIPLEDIYLNIVCGANNVHKGAKVVVAKIGALLNNDSFEIKPRKIKDQPSEGMICSYKELYTSSLVPYKKEGGILLLGDTWDLNRPFNPSHLNLDDVIFNVSFPYNRKAFNALYVLVKELKKNLPEDLVKPNLPFDYSSLTLLNPNDGYIQSLLLNNGWDGIEPFLFLVKHLFNQDIVIKGSTLVKLNPELPKFFNEPLISTLSDVYKVSFTTESAHKEAKDQTSSFIVSWDEISSLFSLTPEDISQFKTHLSKHDFIFEEDKVTVPHWRDDLKNHDDFLNELSMYFSLDNIPCQPRNIVLETLNGENDEYMFVKKIQDFFDNNGFIETNTFNLQPREKVEESKVFKDLNIHVVDNPSTTCDTLRHHALNELIDVLKYNLQHKNKDYPIYELSMISQVGIHRWVLNIGALCVDRKFVLNNTNLRFDGYDIHALLIRLSKVLGTEWSFVGLEEDKYLFKKDRALKVISKEDGVDLGYIGVVNLADGINCVGAIVLLDKPYIKGNCIQAKELVKFPISVKDISLVVKKDSTIKLQEIIDVIKSNQYCIDCNIEDKYDIDGDMSYLFSCVFQAKDRTLTKKELNENIDLIYRDLILKGIEIR